VDALSSGREERTPVRLLDVDPHESTHTATALDPVSIEQAGSLRFEASLAEYRRLLAWGRRWPQRKWVVENANGLGRHLAQWLVARGETVFDVPASATSRVRQLTRGRGSVDTVVLAAAAAGELTKGIGVATVRQTTVRLRLAQAQRVCVQGGPRGGDSTACLGAHRVGQDSIP
jgi:hypothetical protein